MSLTRVWIANCDAQIAPVGCPSYTSVTGGDRTIVTARRALMALGWAISNEGLVLCPRHLNWDPLAPPAA
jgi:hypothetical protein